MLTLLAFLPVLVRLSSNVMELPLFGSIPPSAGVRGGTGILALIGIRLPRIEFFNQRVEAAYRKELALGEDDPARHSADIKPACLATFAEITFGSI